MMNEIDLIRIYKNLVHGIKSGRCDDAYNRGYAAALESVLELEEGAGEEL